MLEAVFHEPATGHAAAGARRAADDNPLVGIEISRASLKVCKRDISTTSGVPRGEFAWRSDVDDHGTSREQAGNFSACADFDGGSRQDPGCDERHQDVLQDIGRGRHSGRRATICTTALGPVWPAPS